MSLPMIVSLCLYPCFIIAGLECTSVDAFEVKIWQNLNLVVSDLKGETLKCFCERTTAVMQAAMFPLCANYCVALAKR